MASELDDEIENLHAQVASLKDKLKIQAATIISAPSTRHLFPPPPSTPLSLPTDNNPLGQKLRSHSHAQAAHNALNLHRTMAGITAFRARDPDPCAVAGGHILGLRIEVMTRARFARPYYVLLNCPFAAAPDHLRVHRHTVPPSVPLPGLAARWLAAPGGKAQDLVGFVRALRREIVRYHNRMAVVGDLRRAVGLEDAEGVVDQGWAVVDVSAADAEAKQIKIEWADGRTGRLVMDDDGEVTKLVVFGESGRDRKVARQMLGDGKRVEDVAQRLGSV